MDNAVGGRYTLIHGRLTAELPVSLANTRLAGDIAIGAFSYFNSGCEVGDAEIGRYCSIGQHTIIAPGEHPIDFLSTHPFSADPSGVSAGMAGDPDYARIACTAVSRAPTGRQRVRIGHDVWIGARAIVLRGAEIGHGAIVAAGAVVAGAVEPYAIVGGVPARPIRWRFPPELRARLLTLEWWDYDLAGLGPERNYSEPEALVARLAALIEAGALRRFEPRVWSCAAGEPGIASARERLRRRLARILSRRR